MGARKWPAELGGEIDRRAGGALPRLRGQRGAGRDCAMRQVGGARHAFEDMGRIAIGEDDAARAVAGAVLQEAECHG
jgi:hypothetical protein